MKYTVKVVCYAQKTYTIEADSLEAAKDRYYNGDYDEVCEGGALDGEVVDEEWEG